MDMKTMFSEDVLDQFKQVKDYVTLGSVVNVLWASLVMYAFWPCFSQLFYSEWMSKGLLPKRITLAQSVVMTVMSYVSTLVATKVVK